MVSEYVGKDWFSNNFSLSMQSPVVMMQNLRKEFPKRNKRKSKKRGVKPKKNVLTAVRNLSIAVETREVFGLLGPNGAGKTTALNMVIAEVGPTKGGVGVMATASFTHS